MIDEGWLALALFALAMSNIFWLCVWSEWSMEKSFLKLDVEYEKSMRKRAEKEQARLTKQVKRFGKVLDKIQDVIVFDEDE